MWDGYICVDLQISAYTTAQYPLRVAADYALVYSSECVQKSKMGKGRISSRAVEYIVLCSVCTWQLVSSSQLTRSALVRPTCIRDLNCNWERGNSAVRVLLILC